eukprot:1014538-Rhodomonas_salina.1
MANNPDGEAHINSLRAGLWAIVDSFKGEWIEWFKKIELLRVQLSNMGEQLSDREFREHLFTALRKYDDWKGWVEIQESKRP